MVILHVKIADQSLFLFETQTLMNVGDVLKVLIDIHNGRLKIQRLCYEIEELAKYGVSLPPNMQGLAEDQISDLNLKDEWAAHNLCASDYTILPDPMGKRNGLAPTEKYIDILTKTTAEAKLRISQKLLESGKYLTPEIIQDTLDILRGAVLICYPMGLPPYEIIKLELEGTEDLSGTQASKEILKYEETELWWAGKSLEKKKALSEYVGKNEKSKIVVKLQKRGHGPPAREAILTEQQKKDLMLAQYHRQEELKKLDLDEDDSHLDSQWADNQQLRKSFLGLNTIRFK